MPEEAPPERISADDLAYHRHLLTEVTQAQQQIAQIQASIQALIGSWTRHLVARYNLQGQDRVGPDGVIHREVRRVQLDNGETPEE